MSPSSTPPGPAGGDAVGGRRLVARSLTDSSVVVAGGTSGIGLAAAHRFAEAGVPRIALLGRGSARGEAAAAAVRERSPAAEVVFIPVDATDADDVHRAFEDVLRDLGGVDVLVSSVSSGYVPKLLASQDRDDLSRTLCAQALPPIHLAHAALPLLRARGGGSIVVLASDAAKVATPGEAVLGAAMAAIVMFSRTLALEGARDGIRVNAVTPSLVTGTPTADEVLQDPFGALLMRRAASMAHLGVPVPDDLAELIVFLAGPGAARITGQTISVNGGISAAW